MPEGREVFAFFSGSAAVVILFAGLVLGFAAVGVERPAAADGEARPARPALGGHHRQAHGRHGRGDDLREGRQRRRRGLRHAGRRLHHVRRPELGRGDPGPDLQPADEKGHRRQRPGRRPDRRDARSFSRPRASLSARLRPAGGRDARHAGRAHDHAGRIRDDEPQGRPRSGHRAGRGLSDGKGDGRPIEKDKEQIKTWPYSRKVLLPHLGEKWEAPEPGEIFRQPDLAETLSKLVEAESRALADGKIPQGGHLRRLRPLLQRRHRPRIRPRRAASRAGSSPRRTWPAGRSISKSRS